MANTETGYNGWTNHSTWAVGLHLMDTIVEIIIDDIDYWKKEDVTDAAQVFKDHIEDAIEMSDMNPLLLDLLDTDSINYQELGQHALDAALS